MTEPTYGDYDITEVDGYDRLISRIKGAGDDIEAWSKILSDYLSFGNRKIDKSVAIFNMNSATDCPNADTKHCQVSFDDCYAHRAENTYPNTLPYRRRQEYLWDCLDADTFVSAFLQIVDRKQNDVNALRLSEAGDFRHNGDIYKADRIAKLLSEHNIKVYTYSATNYLDWDFVDHFTVNQSNDFSDYGDRLYTAVETVKDIPQGGVHCPYEATDGEIKCGDCVACITKDAPDVYITLH